MKNSDTTALLLLLATVILTSCSGSAPTPLTSPRQTDTPNVVIYTETNTSLPTNTALPFSINTFPPAELPTATPSATLLPPLDTPIPIPGGIVYYYFVDIHHVPPEGSVVVMADNLILAPAQLDIIYGTDVAADLRKALEAALQDKRNTWFGDKLEIKNISLSRGHAKVSLEGEYYAVAPVVLTAARAQILMSLFAYEAVQSATVTINGENISNIALSHSMDAKPADYAYTRAEIESFMAENASGRP